MIPVGKGWTVGHVEPGMPDRPAQPSLNCHRAAPLGHWFLSFAVSGPAHVQGKMIICYSDTVMPLLQTGECT